MQTEPGVVWRLSRHGKFRLEDGFVMLCHCRYLHDFRVPLSLHATLIRLRQEGIPESAELDEDERKLMSDLRKVRLLTRDGSDLDDPGFDLKAAATVWDRMSYKEEEGS